MKKKQASEVVMERKNGHRGVVLCTRDKVIGFALFSVIGFFPFISINAIFGEIAIFVDRLPEKGSIATILGISFQCGNIFPLIMVLLGHKGVKFREKPMLGIFIWLGVLDTVLLAIFWDSTAVVNGSEHSVGLIALSFLSGVVGTTGVVFLYAFVSSRFIPEMITAVSTGLAASGGLVTIFSIPQGGSNHLRYSVGAYFAAMSVFTACSFFTFAIVLYSKLGQRLLKKELRLQRLLSSDHDSQDGPKRHYNEAEKGQASKTDSAHSDEEDATGSTESELKELPITTAAALPHPAVGEGDIQGSGVQDLQEPKDPSQGDALPVSALTKEEKRAMTVSMLCVLSTGFMTYFVTPGIQPYTVTGHDSPALLYISNGFLIGNIVGRVFTLFFKTKRVWLPVLLQLAITLWLFITALIRSQSLLAWSQWAFVPAMILFSVLNGFIVTNAYFVQEATIKHRPTLLRSSRWLGMMNQIGAFSGTVVALVLVLAGVFG